MKAPSPAEQDTSIDPEYPGVDTHWTALRQAIEASAGPVLELGCSRGSTKQLHDLCARLKRPLVTLDHDGEWLAKFSSLATATLEVGRARHSLRHVVGEPDLDMWDVAAGYLCCRERWGAVLVNDEAVDWRLAALSLARSADFIVFHASEPSWESFLSVFPYRRTFAERFPETMVVSCFSPIFRDEEIA